jgi:hypothetical protein
MEGRIGQGIENDNKIVHAIFDGLGGGGGGAKNNK